MSQIKWRQQASPDLILKNICHSRQVVEGGVSTSRLRDDFDKWVSVLSTSFEDPLASEALKNTAIRQAVGAQQNINKSDFESYYYKAKNSLIEKSRRYIVCLPLWGRFQYCVGQIRRGAATIHLNPSLTTQTSKNIQIARTEQMKSYKEIFTTIFSDNASYKNAYCWVQATSPDEAHELAFSALSEYVAAINFWDKHGQGWRIYSGLQRPIAEFVIAPYGTVHSTTGRIVYDGFFYHEWYPKRTLPTKRKVDFQQSVVKNAKLFLSKADKSAWKVEACRALRLYGEAFSHHETQNALLAGWRLLEHISGRREEKIDVKISRVSRMFKEHREFEMVANHIRERRNAITHGIPIGAGDGDAVVHQLKELIQPLFRHFIINPFGFANLEEFWGFLDVPRSKLKRKRNQYILDKAAIFFAEGDD